MHNGRQLVDQVVDDEVSICGRQEPRSEVGTDRHVGDRAQPFLVQSPGWIEIGTPHQVEAIAGRIRSYHHPD